MSSIKRSAPLGMAAEHGIFTLGMRTLRRWAGGVAAYPDSGWLTVLLAFAVSGTVAWSVEAAAWVPNLPGFLPITLFGGALGLRAAQTRSLQISPHVGMILIGFAASFALTVATVPGTALEGRALTTAHRITLWAQALLDGGASTDRIAFVAVLLFAAFLLPYVTVYLTLKLRSVWGVLPAGFALFSNLTYLPASALVWLLLYLLASGLLVVQLVYLERNRAWQLVRAEPTGALSLHLLHAGFWFAVAIFVITSVIPTTGSGPNFLRSGWAELRSPLGDAEGTFTRIFASLPARKSLALYGFTGELPFRGNISLSEDVVMLVESDQPFYWRARTYDVYNGWGWENGPLQIDRADSLSDLSQNSRVTSACPECVKSMTVNTRSPTTIVYSAGEPLRTTVAVEALFLSSSQGARGERVVKLESRRVLQPNQRYTVQMFVPEISSALLQTKGVDYPEWVAERYLALPEEVPFRVRNLANRLTAGAATPYDKVFLVRQFLRTLDYSQDIEAPPPGRDALAYFLFT
ncbi:MAG: hypothetical protein O3B84_03595, partial [Chloroflexi bacterium]|nr:hypothetical protein [Chloroflexota bacterium]